MAEGVLDVSDTSFEQDVLKSDKPVLVDFWAPWCGPCQMVGPIVEEIAKDNAEKLSVAKVNVDDCPNVATEYGVMSIPTLIVFKGGQEVERHTGALPKPAVQQLVSRHF
jgi:thioredoxin 1